MPTNEERREVARKLRGEKCGFAGWVGAVYIALEVDGETAGCDMLDLLADLIEPEPERKAKSMPFPIEEDTGFFDTTKCECGYLNDVSATYCGQCGCVIEVIQDAN